MKKNTKKKKKLTIKRKMLQCTQHHAGSLWYSEYAYTTKSGLTILVARAHRRYYEKSYVNYNYIYVDAQKRISYTILMHSMVFTADSFGDNFKKKILLYNMCWCVYRILMSSTFVKWAEFVHTSLRKLVFYNIFYSIYKCVCMYVRA